MKKVKTLIALFAIAACGFAADLSIAPVSGATTYSTTYNSQTINNVFDVTSLGAGERMCFDISLTNIEFTLAGWEFLIYFPANSLCLSENTADWNNGDPSGLAVFTPGPLFQASSVQLPSDENANRTVTTLNNGQGTIRVGHLFTDQAARPVGSEGTPHAGGVLGTVCFDVESCGAGGTPLGGAECVGNLHSVRVVASPVNTANADIFADENAQRVSVVSSAPVDAFGLTGLPAYFGNPGKTSFKGDGNHDNLVGAADALNNAICSLLGQAGQGCNSSGTGQDFIDVLDSNCSGAVDAGDALRNVMMALTLSSRDSFKKADGLSLKQENGTFLVDAGKQVAASSIVRLDLNGISVKSMDLVGDSDGWMFVKENFGDHMNYALIRVNPKMATIPTVRVAYERVGGEGVVSFGETLHQEYSQREIDFTPVLREVFGKAK
jgi:hypothetical protein